MTPELLEYLCDPVSGDPLSLADAEMGDRGRIVSGSLVSRSGLRYPIRRGIPRFVSDERLRRTVKSFGDQWNYFNFIAWRRHWQEHFVAHTFGNPEVFRGQLIVDAGGGSGAQSVWMLEHGARHVVILELSDSVDDVVLRNLEGAGYENWDVVQCSIDQPPLRKESVQGLVICHNVIQHTPSVERTAHSLFSVVAPGGQLVFNCYPKNDAGWLRWVRFHGIYEPLRHVLRRCPFPVILWYARTMGALRLVPGLGWALEKANLCVRGEVLGARGRPSVAERFRATVLNTFDAFGSHEYQHHKSEAEIRALVRSLQPDASKVRNLDLYFRRPPPIGCAIRVYR